MIKEIGSQVWHSGKKISSILRVDKKILMGGFKGEVGVLETQTGMISWNSIEQLKESHIVSITKINFDNHEIFLFQTKDGKFAILGSVQNSFSASLQLLGYISTDLLGLSPFPCHQISAAKWVILTTQINPENHIRVISIEHEMEGYTLKEQQIQIVLLSEQTKKQNLAVNFATDGFEHAMVVNGEGGAVLILLHELLCRTLLLSCFEDPTRPLLAMAWPDLRS